MAINDGFNSEDGYSNPFSGLLKGALTLAPVGVGGAIGIRRLQANEALSPSSFGGSRTGLIGREIGKLAKAADIATRKARQQAADDFASKLLEGSGISKVLKEVQDQHSIIQAMFSALEDPATGLDEHTILGFKERLLNAASNLKDEEDIRATLQGMIGEMYENNRSGLNVFQARLDEFKRHSNQLSVPTFPPPALSQPFNPIEAGSLKGRAKKRYERIRGAISNRSRAAIEVVQTSEHTGATGLYARIFRPGGKDRQFATMIPLDIDVGGKLTDPAGEGYHIVRAGEAGTAYRADRYLIDARKAQNVLTRNPGGELNFQTLRAGGAIVDIEDFYINRFVDQMQDAGRDFRRFRQQGFNASVREILDVENRMASMRDPKTGKFTALAQHIRKLSRIESNTARVVGLEHLSEKDRIGLFRGFAGSRDFGYGSGADRLAEQNIENRRSFSLSLRNRFSFEGMNKFGGVFGRTLEPLTARAEQVTNRLAQAAMFIGGNPRADKTAPIAAQLGAGQRPFFWSDDLGGAINKAIVFDVGTGPETRAFRALSGTGQAYHMGSDIVRSAFTKPIAAPISIVNGRPVVNNLVSPLLNKVLSQPAGTFVDVEGGGRTRQLIGPGPGGAQYIGGDPRARAMRLTWKYARGSAGKETIHLVGEMDRELETTKLFGRLFKGTILETSLAGMRDLFKSYGMNFERFLGSYGIGREHLMVADPDMLKKSPAALMRQMMTGFGFASGQQDWENILADTMSSVVREKSGAVSKLTSNQLGTTAATVIRALKTSGVSSEKAGQVLAAVYNRGLSNTDSWAGQFTLDAGAFEEFVQSEFGKMKGAEVLKHAAKGVAIAGDSLTGGIMVGDWHLARSSIEPRFLENLQARLKDAGLSDSQTSEFLFSIYRNKMGYGDHIRVAGNMMAMTRSIKGMRSLVDELPGAKKPSRLSVEQVIEGMKTSGGDLSKFMRQHEEGIIMDMKSHSNLRTQAAMRAAAEKTFGGQGEIFLPGGEAMESMRGTFIKTAGGERPVEIGSAYEKLIKGFGHDLRQLTSIQTTTSAEMAQAFDRFARDANLMSARAFHAVSAGKIRGSASMMAHKYDFETGIDLVREVRKGVTELEWGRTIMRKTGGTAVWVNDHGFLSMVKDFIGTGNQLNESGNKIIDSVEEAANKLRMFYTGSELGEGQLRGVYSVSTRHPELSRGNMPLTQIFRDVRTVGKHGSQDKVFQRIAATDWGKKALSKFGGKAKSFGDIARLASGEWVDKKGKTVKGHRAVQNFFNAMARNLSDFVGTQGGGRVFMPTVDLDVHYSGLTGGPLKVDFGIASAAIGDWDGDQWGLFLLDKRAGRLFNEIRSTLSDPEGDYLRAETLYKMKSQVYAEEAKKGLKSFLGGLAPSEVEDALKEKMSKEATGLLDTHLDELRIAVLNLGGASAEEISGAQALLKVLEEHTTIKGKKLPVYRPWAQELVAATTDLMERGDISSFESVLRNNIFRGRQIMSEGVKVEKIGEGGEGIIHRGVVGDTLRIEDELDVIRRAANSARAAGPRYSMRTTPKMMAYAMGIGGAEGQEAVASLYYAGQSLASGIMQPTQELAEQAMSAFDQIRGQITRATSRLNRAAMGPVVTGLGAAMVVGGLLSDGGYSPEPLMAPGETVSPRVRSAMADGSLFRNQGGPSADSMQRQEDRYAMMDRPINTGATYMRKPSTYQVSVESSSPGGYGGMSSYLSQLPGMSRNTSVRVNDTRMPITSNYYDRLTGEY